MLGGRGKYMLTLSLDRTTQPLYLLTLCGSHLALPCSNDTFVRKRKLVVVNCATTVFKLK